MLGKPDGAGDWAPKVEAKVTTASPFSRGSIVSMVIAWCVSGFAIVVCCI